MFEECSAADFELGSECAVPGHYLQVVCHVVQFQKMEKTEFLAFFYKYSLHVLTAPLFANTTEEKPSKGETIEGLSEGSHSAAVIVLQS